MKKLIKYFLNFAMCFLLSSCGGINAPHTATALSVPTVTPFPTFPSYSPKQVILNYTLGGTHDSFDLVLGLTRSKVVLYSDGQLIISGTPYRQKQLTNEETDWLLSGLEFQGFYTIETNQQHDPTDQLYNFGDEYQEVYDGLYICITVNHSIQRKLCTYEHYKEFLKPPMTNILKFMDEFEPEDLSIYQPNRLLLAIQPGRAGFIDENTKSVAWPTNFPSLRTDKWKILYIDGKAAIEVFGFFNNSQTIKVINENGNEYTVEVRPLLPHEIPFWR